MTTGARSPAPLDSLLARARRRVAVWGTLRAVAVALPWLGLVALGLGWPEETRLAGRLAAAVAAAVGLALAVAVTAAPTAAVVARRRRFVAALDRAAGARNLLVAADESRHRPGRWQADPVARRAAAAVAAGARALLARTDAASLLRLPGARQAGPPLLLGAALLLLAATVDGPVLRRGWTRLVHPLRPDHPVPAGGLYPADNPEAVPARSDLALAALDFGTPRGPVTCEVREGDGPWRPLPARPAPPDSLPAPCRCYRAVLRDVRHDLVYRFRRDGMVTPARTVRVLYPPLLARLDVVVEPPAYTGLPPDTLRGVTAAVEVPAGSRLHWLGTASRPLRAARSVTAAGETLAWRVRDDTLALDQTVRRSTTWRLWLTDDRGITGGGRVARRLEVLPDRPPVAVLAVAAGDSSRLVTPVIRLRASADDDYGLARMALLLRRESAAGAADTTWQRLTLWTAADGPAAPGEAAAGPLGRAGTAPRDWPAAGRRLHLDGDLELTTRRLLLVPGDILAVCLEARDHRPGGGGTGRSAVLRFLVPGRPDLAAAATAAQDSQRAALDDLAREGRRLAEELAALRRRLLRDSDPDFSERQRIAAALDRQRELQQQLAELSRRLEEQMDAAARSDMVTPDLLARADAIAAELAKLQDSRTAELQRRLRQALADSAGGEKPGGEGTDRFRTGEPQPSPLADLLKELQGRQQEALDRMARARSLLSELQREQEMTGLAGSLEDLLRRQQSLRDAAERPAASPAERRERARQQEALAAEMERLRQQMEQSLQELGPENTGEQPSPAEQEMRRALQEALEALAQQKPEEQMRRAAHGMAEGGDQPPPDAARAQQQALEALASLYHIVLRGQQAMQMAMQQFAASTLRRLAFTLLDLSRRQEALAHRIPDDLRARPRPELAREQKRIIRHLVARREALSEAAGASAQVPFRLLQQLDKVADRLAGALDALRGGWGSQARSAARDGLGGINQLVMNMLTSAQTVGQGGGGGSQSLPMLAQQLQQMSAQQAALNAATEALQRRLQEDATAEARAQMPRLQAQQQALAGQARAADSLRMRLPDGDRLLGDLRELADEMETVARQIGRGEVDDAVLRRQERILGRLLDAQHSVRQRDFEMRRRGKAAAHPLARQQGRRDNAAADSARVVRAAPPRRVPARYRELVREYFRTVRRWLPSRREVLP